jgi:hypothetical protein
VKHGCIVCNLDDRKDRRGVVSDQSTHFAMTSLSSLQHMLKPPTYVEAVCRSNVAYLLISIIRKQAGSFWDRSRLDYAKLFYIGVF